MTGRYLTGSMILNQNKMSNSTYSKVMKVDGPYQILLMVIKRTQDKFSSTCHRARNITRKSVIGKYLIGLMILSLNNLNSSTCLRATTRTRRFTDRDKLKSLLVARTQKPKKNHGSSTKAKDPTCKTVH